MSCWRMWFALPSLVHFSKENILGFHGAKSIQLLENDVIFVELYDDPFNADNSKNRKIQMDFRNILDIDKFKDGFFNLQKAYS